MIILGEESFKVPQILFSLPDSLAGFFFQSDKFASGFQKEEEVGEFGLVISEREFLLMLELIGFVPPHVNVSRMDGISFI